MKAFVVTIVTPEGWATQDVLIAINLGAQALVKMKEKDERKLDMGIEFHAMIHQKFELKKE